MTAPVHGRSDEGFTLVEILVAISLLAIAVTAIVSGMMTSILASDVHRKQATGESVSRGYAEAVKAAATAIYNPCGVALTYAPALLTFNPDHYAVSITAVDYWDSGSGTWKAQPAPTCLTTDTVQRFSLAISSEDVRSDETVQIVVRRGN